jgi:hypothetical protein
MELEQWLNQTPRSEVEEALDSTMGTISELLGVYINNHHVPLLNRAVRLHVEFELMLEAAKDHYDELEEM